MTRLSRYKGLVVASVAAALLCGCPMLEEKQRRQDDAEARQKRLEQEQAAAEAAARLRAEEAARVEQAKARLRQDPSSFLETSDLAYYDKGFINDYRQLVQMSILNKSQFAVTDIRGDVDWVDGSGQRVGSVPFSLKGSIPAGDTKRFSQEAGTLTNGTLQTSAKRAVIRVTHVKIVE